jgi:hypothetical protein
MLFIICLNPFLMLITLHQQVIHHLIKFSQLMAKLFTRGFLFLGVDLDLHELVFLFIVMLLQVDAELD